MIQIVHLLSPHLVIYPICYVRLVLGVFICMLWALIQYYAIYSVAHTDPALAAGCSHCGLL